MGEITSNTNNGFDLAISLSIRQYFGRIGRKQIIITVQVEFEKTQNDINVTICIGLKIVMLQFSGRSIQESKKSELHQRHP